MRRWPAPPAHAAAELRPGGAGPGTEPLLRGTDLAQRLSGRARVGLGQLGGRLQQASGPLERDPGLHDVRLAVARREGQPVLPDRSRGEGVRRDRLPDPDGAPSPLFSGPVVPERAAHVGERQEPPPTSGCSSPM